MGGVRPKAIIENVAHFMNSALNTMETKADRKQELVGEQLEE